ncbi:hypothetical protein ACWEO2_01990 [Nocardia sp. NPDC004278]
MADERLIAERGRDVPLRDIATATGAQQLSGAPVLRLPIAVFIQHVRRKSVLLSASAR